MKPGVDMHPIIPVLQMIWVQGQSELPSKTLSEKVERERGGGERSEVGG